MPRKSFNSRSINDAPLNYREIAAWLADNHENTYKHFNIALNTTHRDSTGEDHSFIDQSIVSGASPTLDGTNFTGIDISAGTNLSVTSPVTLTADAVGWSSALVDNTTWSDGDNAANTWTFDVSGTNHTMIAGDSTMGFSHAVSVGTTLTAFNALIAPSATAQYLLKGDSAGTSITLANTISAQASILRLYAADGNRSDVVGIQIHSKGNTTSRANNERLDIQSTRTDPWNFEIKSTAAGADPGVAVRPLKIYTGANTSQLVLNTDGSINMGDALTIADDFTVNINTFTVNTTTGLVTVGDSLTVGDGLTVDTTTLVVDSVNHLVLINGIVFQGLATGNIAIGDSTTMDAHTSGVHNVCLGAAAGTGITSGYYNTAISRYAMKLQTAGRHNIAIGYVAEEKGNSAGNTFNIGIGAYALQQNTVGVNNTALGVYAGAGVSGNSHSNNSFFGYSSGLGITTGSSNIFLGNFAGSRQANLSNLLIIDNQVRADVATELTNSIIYGVMAAAPADQTLRINANVGVGVTPTAVLHLKAGTATASTGPLKFTAGVALTTPETGVLEFHDSRLYMTNKSVRKALDRTSDVALATVTVVDEAAETTVWTATMPANSLVAGNVMKFHADGVVSNNGNNSDNDFTLRVRLASITGTILIDLTPSTKAMTDVHWHMNANATQRTVGGSGARAYHIHLTVGDADEEIDMGVVNINTEATMDLLVTVDWATAHANNSFSLYQGYMEYKN